jgi:transcriptional regulator with GAF, ATPase, and Fis domain
LFLDEVGELPLSMQAKLLRFLQDGEVQRLGSSDIFRVDVRVISATNVNLLRCVQEKQFRQDLYYRLAVFPLELPPLRQRREDIVPLAEHFLDALSEQSCVPSKRISPSTASLLRQHLWPGNVRELQHAVERAFILAGDERQIRVSHFSLPETFALP